MAAGDDALEDRTETATVYRREEFRKQGIVALSRELLSVVMLFIICLAFYFLLTPMFTEFKKIAIRFFQFQRIDELTTSGSIEILGSILSTWGWMVGPLFLVVCVSGVSICIAQVGFYWTWEPLEPNWDRINPIRGLGRVFSWTGSAEALKAILKMIIGGWVIWSFFNKRMLSFGELLYKDPASILNSSLRQIGELFLSIVAALGIVAALDFFFQRFRVERQMRMTKKEVKEEMRLREGDPLIKNRIKSIQRRIASKRMMEAVPKADVVVTNPTHLAVALKYDPTTMAAPRVVAKGAGVIAQKIRELAKANGVPLVENKPLARALFKEIDIGKSVSRELYKAVAQVLAHVYRLKMQTSF
jgi:flagellar biosynthetic protein FlhB